MEFNPKVNPEQTPQYSGASRGVDYQADRSSGMLFEGLGKAFEGLVKGLDESVQENIRQDTQKGFDAINKEFGVDAATATMGHPRPGPNSIADQTAENQPLPETIRRAGDQLRSLSQAASQSPTLEAHFGSRMHSLVRQLRGKYPGYRTQIDEIVSSVTGMKPANYLRNELFQEIQKGVTSQQKSFDDLVKSARDKGHLGGYPFVGGRPVDPTTGQPLSVDQLNNLIATGEGKEAKTRQQNAALELKSKENKLSTEDATQTFTARANTHVAQRLNNALGESGQSWQKIVALVQNMNTGVAQGQTPKPEDLAQARGLINNLRMQIRTELDGIYKSPFAPNSVNSFATVGIKPEDATKIMDQSMSVISMMEEGLTNNNWGLVKAATTFLETQKNSDMAERLKKYPIERQVQAARSIYGDAVTGYYVMNMPKVREALTDAVLQSQRLGAITDNPPTNPQRKTSLIEDLQNAQKDKVGGPELTKAHIDSWLAEVRRPDRVDDKLLAQTSLYMFGNKNLNIATQMSATDRQSFLTQVASPEVHQRLVKMKETYPEAYSAYQAWTLSTAQAVVKDSVDELQKFNLDRREIMIAWNPQTNRFQEVQNPSAGDRHRYPDGKINPGAVVRDFLVDQLTPFNNSRLAYASIKPAVEKLNQTIATVAPIIIDNKQDVGVQMNMLLRALGAQTQGGRTTTDFLLEGLTRAQAASEVQPNATFQPTVDLWKTLTPYQPVWEQPANSITLGEERTRQINQRVELDPKNTYILGDSLGVGISQAMKLPSAQSLAQNGLRITDPKLVQQIATLPQGANAVVSVGTNDAYAGDAGILESPAALNNLIRAAKERGVTLTIVGPPNLPKNDEAGKSLDQTFAQIAKDNPGVRYVSSRDQNFQRAGDQLHMTAKGYQDLAVHAGFRPAFQAPAGGLDALIASGEGDYNSYNRGVAGDSQNAPRLNLTGMTVREIVQKQQRRELFAVGKFQIIPSTMQEAIREMKLDLDQKFTPELQHRINRQFLIGTKAGRDVIKSFVTGATENLGAAQLALAQEFASIANPFTGRSHYAGLAGNAASISAQRAAAVLRAERTLYQQYITAGQTPEQAWLALSGLR